MISTCLTRIDDIKLSSVRAGHEIWTTLEGANPGGSIKDRMVYHEISNALSRGDLKKGDTVSEVSAGSTALSLAFYSRHFGLGCILFVPLDIEKAAREKLEGLGARLHLVDPATAYVDYDLFCATQKSWRLDQIKRIELRDHYEKWAKEKLAGRLPMVDLVFGAVGTGLSLLGIGAGLRPSTGLITAEPQEPRLIHGIRNLRLEGLGESDPCDSKRLAGRIELAASDFFSAQQVSSESGELAVSDSFRVVLGAIDSYTQRSPASKNRLVIFAVGTHNRLRS